MEVLTPRRPAPARRAPGRWEQRLDRLVLSLGGVSHDADGSVRGRGVLRVIQIAERLAKRGHDEHLLRPDGIIRYEIGSLPAARPLPLPDAPPVLPGEPVVVLHWDNRNVAALARSFPNRRTMTFRGSLVVREELQALADLARAGGLPQGVRAAWTEALIWPMLLRYGFSGRPAARTLRTPFVRLYLLGLLALYNGDDRERVLDGRRLRLGEAWIALDALQRRFPDHARQMT